MNRREVMPSCTRSQISQSCRFTMSQKVTASPGSKSGLAISSGWNRKSQTTVVRPADSGQTVVVELPDQRLLAIQPLDPQEDDALLDELLAADLPPLGQILLVHLNSYEGQVKQNGRLYQGHLLAMLENRNAGLGPIPPGYDFGAKQPEVTRRVMEAWNWLERQGS